MSVCMNAFFSTVYQYRYEFLRSVLPISMVHSHLSGPPQVIVIPCVYSSVCPQTCVRFCWSPLGLCELSKNSLTLLVFV